jgi:CHAD domain-containing protein
VKKRLDWFDELRDTHVQLSLLRPMWRDFPEARPLKKLLERREARSVSRLRRKLKAARLNRLNRRLKRLEQELRPASGFASARAAGRQAAAALRAAFGRAARLRQRVRRDRTETLHRLRLAFKHYRYMSELLLPVAPWISPRRLKGMKAYQDLAGNIQDLEVLLARVALAVENRELAAPDVRPLRRELSQHRRQAIAAFLGRMDDLFAFQPPEANPPLKPNPE